MPPVDWHASGLGCQWPVSQTGKIAQCMLGTVAIPRPEALRATVARIVGNGIVARGWRGFGVCNLDADGNPLWRFTLLALHVAWRLLPSETKFNYKSPNPKA